MSLICAALWLYYFVLHGWSGPLNSDERYFSHIFWLRRHGLVQYVDFYAQHLPTYFATFAIFLPKSDDLNFIYVLRSMSCLFIIPYILLVRKVSGSFLSIPLLLFFLVMARMLEIRTDTPGLFLMNGAWAMLLVSGRSRAVVLAAVLACAAALFSARGFFILGGFGAYCIFRCINRRDTKLFLALAGLAAALLAVLLSVWFANPDFFIAAVRATFITPIGVVRPISIEQKLGSLSNLILIALYISALAYAVQNRGDRRQQVVAFAVATQLILLVVDPAPYNYVYGWAAIPVIAAVADFSNDKRNYRRLTEPLVGIAITALFAAFPIAYLIVKGHQPPLGSTYRLVADAPVDPMELARMNDVQLVDFSLSGGGQETLQGQLATFAAICARFQPTVLTRFALNPVCLRDTQYEWTGLTMPSLSAHPISQAAKRIDFEHAFASRPPTLFISKSPDEPGLLDPWVKRLLTGYEIHDGFAIRQRAVPKRVPSAGVTRP